MILTQYIVLFKFNMYQLIIIFNYLLKIKFQHFINQKLISGT